ncbi:hypothetical protein LMUP508_02198 [Limosilactobacillus mucosae]|uniref:Transposase putative helix-turn-helix domain-containing protein n=1 Tax=Limosilactobacillus mucosae TaxID=97478 RepID=A0A508YZJ2_LIMMU|nr:hypothetical protein LMUP508_02198 [Limosilactobacillus mucosae]
MKSMAQLEYHYGLKIRIYPSDYQKQIIKVNSDASRFVYNEMVAIGKELWQLNRIKLSIDTVQDRIQQLKLRQNAKSDPTAKASSKCQADVKSFPVFRR